MKNTQVFIVEREKDFFNWLSTQVTSKQLSDLYMVLPVINDYGKKRSQVAKSIFELGDSAHAKKFQKMIQDDKRFQFVNYGQSKQILLFLEKYCEYFESKEATTKKITSEAAEKQSNQPLTIPIEKQSILVSGETGSIVLRTKSGAIYYGNTPAEALASLCEKLALSHSKGFQRLVGERYYGQGSVVLSTIKPKNGGIWIKQGFCYIDSTLQETTAQYYGQWLCKMLGDLDLPVAVTSFDRKPEAKEKRQQTIISPGKSDKTESKQETAARNTAASPLRNETLQPVAAKKQDEVTRKPGTVPRPGLDEDLEALLAGKEYAQLRDELVSQKVTSLVQFKALDLWAFMNWAGLYSIGRRQEICKQIKAMLDPQKEENIGKQYCLKTQKGKCYYGNNPAKALAAYYDDLAPRTPLTIRKLIGQRYNGIGMVVLHADMPKNGGIQLSNPTAYLSSDLNERSALYYAIWLCRKCKELDEPVSLKEVSREILTKQPEPLQPKAEEKPVKITDEMQDKLTGEDWLLSMLAKKGIKYEDKRDNQGCLWILGGHELDQFVKQCAAKGYRFSYKADGYKAFKKGPAWWTVNRDIKQLKVETGEPEGSKHNDNLALVEVIRRILSESKQSMTTTEIYTEIRGKNLFKFGIGNPFLTINAAIRRTCEGISSDQSSNNIFGCTYDQQGNARYYLLEKDAQETKNTKPVNIIGKSMDGQATDSPTQVSSSPTTNYMQKQIEQQIEQKVQEADLDGITIDSLADALGKSVLGIKKLLNENNTIVDICGKMIHKSAFVDWDQAANQLEKILVKLMEKNNGYVSKAQLYEYARAEMQMFMIDNDMENEQKIYDMAMHLFSKEKYHGTVYMFSNMQHISKSDAEMSSVLDVIKTFAREQGGFFKEDDLISYLENVKIKTGNLRSGIMHIYEKPTFLFYDYHVFVFSECLGINDEWLSGVNIALDHLFEDMGDHVIIRDIEPVWYAQLPALPADRPWTGILLQSVLQHYGKVLRGAKTICAYQSLSGDYLQSMLVSSDSEVQTFNDAVIAVLVDNQIEQREFESSELRKILINMGLIGNKDLTGGLSKYIESDERFVWSNNGQRVSIRI